MEWVWRIRADYQTWIKRRPADSRIGGANSTIGLICSLNFDDTGIRQQALSPGIFFGCLLCIVYGLVAATNHMGIIRRRWVAKSRRLNAGCQHALNSANG